MSWAGCPGQRDSYTWYLEALAGGLSLIPQREINCAYSLICSHSNDCFVLFLTLGALKGCPILIRRPGELLHRHSKRAPLDVGLCVMWSSPLFCPHLSLTKQAFMSPLYHWSQGTLKRLSHVHGATKLVKGSAGIWTQLPLTSGSVLLPYSSPQSKPKCIPPTPSPPVSSSQRLGQDCMSQHPTSSFNKLLLRLQNTILMLLLPWGLPKGSSQLDG